MESELGVEREKILPDEPDEAPIRQSGLSVCIDCGVTITPDNDSHWEGFSDDLPEGMTGPLCTLCDFERGKAPILVVEK